MNSSPKSGHTYFFNANVYLPDGFLIRRGDKIKLIKPTGQSPHGWFDHESGHNWLCDGPNGVTVWSTIQWGIRNGLLTTERPASPNQ